MKDLPVLLLLFVISCDRPKCNNTNPVFDKYQPDTREYRTELVRQLELKKDIGLRYWMEKVVERNGHQYLSLYMQGKELCAKGLMDISKWTDMQKLQQGNMYGYSGAELKGLRYTITTDSAGPWLAYVSIKHVAD